MLPVQLQQIHRRHALRILEGPREPAEVDVCGRLVAAFEVLVPPLHLGMGQQGLVPAAKYRSFRAEYLGWAAFLVNLIASADAG